MDEAARPHAFELLPWHRQVWGGLQQARRAGRLPHALLITGQPGLGKLQLARNLAHSLFCSGPDPEGVPCGRCRGCHLYQVGNHPDFHRVAPDPEAKSDEIKIDTVRALVEADGLTAQAGGYKVALVHPAENMNRSASNALLKTLEEPGTGTLLMLVTARPAGLLATIRSRCQQVHVPVPAEEQALAWLAGRIGGQDPLPALRLADGAPLAALDLIESGRLNQRDEVLRTFLALGEGRADPVQAAASWLKLDIPLLLSWLCGWTADLARLASGHPAPRLANPDQQAALARLGARLDPARLHGYWQQAIEARELARSTLNTQLLLESLLIRWAELGKR